MNENPRLTLFGKLVVTLVILGCVVGAVYFLRPGGNPFRKDTPTIPSGGPVAGAPSTPGAMPSAATGVPATAGSASVPPVAEVEVGIAYGTEKERWLRWAVEEFARTPAGRGVRVNLLPMGSLEGAQAVLAGDPRIQVWTPASTLYTENFSAEYQLKHNRKPFVREELLALTPMVFVSWTERAGPFKARLGEFTFTNIATALREKGGWAALAQKPEWGFFKFAHTHPNQSNSGLLTLVLMASDFHNKARGLELADILDPRFQEWMIGLETAVVDLPNSTGNLMRDMVLKGPSTYDVVMVYESVAIDFLKNAEGRWGQLEVSYPRLNLWSDNPYYILDAPGSSAAQRQAGGAFLDFLMTETAQRTALAHGFRPGNPAVAIRFPESPFTLYAKHGLKVDLPSVCERPKAEVLHNLLVGWNNNIRNR